MASRVTERTFGATGMNWSDLLNTFGIPGSIGIRPDEVRWERPKESPGAAGRTTVLNKCVVCGSPIKRRDGQYASEYVKLKTCSKPCAKKNRPRREVPLRCCRHCGKGMERTVSPSTYARKLYCNRECELAWMAENRQSREQALERKRVHMQARRALLKNQARAS